MLKTLLILSPHPDDLELSAGLLTLTTVADGWFVRQVVMTDGRNGGGDMSRFGTNELAAERRREAEEAAVLLGLASTSFLPIEDGTLSSQLSFATRLVLEEMDGRRPTVLVAPSRFDSHLDHKAAAEVARVLAQELALPMMSYCFWGEAPHNASIVAPQFAELRLKAIRAHASQPIDRYLEMLERRGGMSEDRFLVDQSAATVFDLLRPHLLAADSASFASKGPR